MTCTQTVVSFHNMKGESYSSYALQKAEVWMQGWNLHGQDIVYQKFCSIYFLARATKPGGGGELRPLSPPPLIFDLRTRTLRSLSRQPSPPTIEFLFRRHCLLASLWHTYTHCLPHIHYACMAFNITYISHSNQALSICNFGARAYVRVKHRQHVITIANCTKDSCTKIR